MNEQYAKKHFKGEVTAYHDPFQELSKHLKGKRVRCDFRSISAAMAERLNGIAKITDYSKNLDFMRVSKSPEEVAAISKAVKATNGILASIDFSKARTELDVEKQIKVATAEMGLEPAFAPIVATDSSSSFPHYTAGKKKLGSVVLIDYGVRWKHYCSDITRCFVLDNDRKKKQEYEDLQNAFHSIVDSLPGLNNGGQVARTAAKLMEKAGFPKMIHSIGHGVGLDVHELPRMNLKSTDKIKGAVLAIEPAFYGSRYGMRFEETVYFNGKKARIL
jgi:Xaa-Pro dipeptidase